MPYSLNVCLMYSQVQWKTTALKVLRILWPKTFHNLNVYMYVLFSYSFSFDFFYGGNCYSIWLPSKVTLRLPASCNNVPQYINDCVTAFDCVLQQGIEGMGL